VGEYEGLVGEYFGDVGLPRGNSRVRGRQQSNNKKRRLFALTLALNFGTISSLWCQRFPPQRRTMHAMYTQECSCTRERRTTVMCMNWQKRTSMPGTSASTLATLASTPAGAARPQSAGSL